MSDGGRKISIDLDIVLDRRIPSSLRTRRTRERDGRNALLHGLTRRTDCAGEVHDETQVGADIKSGNGNVR